MEQSNRPTGSTVNTPVGADRPATTSGSADIGGITAVPEIRTGTSSPRTSSAGTSGAGTSQSYAPSGDYERTGREVMVVAQQRSRPSAALVIGSAVAGAVAGSAIPFMLSGRKSGRTVSTEHHIEPHADTGSDQRSGSFAAGRRFGRGSRGRRS